MVLRRFAPSRSELQRDYAGRNFLIWGIKQFVGDFLPCYVYLWLKVTGVLTGVFSERINVKRPVCLTGPTLHRNWCASTVHGIRYQGNLVIWF